MKTVWSNAIFFDSGNRWKKLKRVGVVGVAVFILLLFISIFAYLYSPFEENVAFGNTELINQQIEIINNETRKVVNQGTFVTIEEIYGKTYIKRFGEEKKAVVLTFDDGPDPYYTEKILSILQQEGVKGTFFVVGAQIYKYPRVGDAILRQGSDMGLHTFSHEENNSDKKLGYATFLKELDFTEKIFEYHYGYKAKLFRIPFLGLEDDLSYNSLQYVREAYKRGMTISAPTVDAEDWDYRNTSTEIVTNATTSDVQTAVILFHDGGGNRNATIESLPHVIKFYKERNYEFLTVSDLARENGLPYKEPLTLGDTFSSFLTFQIYNAYKKSPLVFERGFIIGFFFVIVHMGLFTFLAVMQKIKSRKRKIRIRNAKLRIHDLVTIVIPMYNEERVICPTVRSVLRSSYKRFELIIVDDGSTDNSLVRLQQISDPRVKILTKANGGKYSALNYGLRTALGKYIIFIDADTRVTSSAIGRIVQYFSDERVGAVAGYLRVGNKRNLLARVQSYEYTVSQSIEKRVFESFQCVLVVPGALGAWRTQVIRKMGGFSPKTHAEDFDLSLSLLKKKYKIRFCENAVAYTEAPLSLQQFFTQRFRWSFGNLQVIFKHRDMLGSKRYGLFGLIFFPRMALVQVPLLLLTPLVDLLVITNILIGERTLTLLFLTFYFLLHGIVTLIAYVLIKEKVDNPLLILLIRFPYTQLLYIVLFSAILQALKGEIVMWSKLQHFGHISFAK